jgi:cyclophilin family peptidyl-prolyl cis-trans isomerase
MMTFPTIRLATALGIATLLSSCGGGGGDSGGPPPVVTLSSTTSVKYSESMLITLTGSNLDQELQLSSAGCKNFVRGTAAPTLSTATVAYYTCTVSGVGNQNITVAGRGVTAATVSFTVAVPQVTLLITGGGASFTSGTVVLTLSPDLTPVTVDNFLAYVKAGFYNGTVFHRHGRFNDLRSFVLQGGGYTGPVRSAAAYPAAKPTNPPIVLERGPSNVRYTVAMARQSAPDTATSQFFINTANNAAILDAPGYAVFATITSGTALVDSMVASSCVLSPINFDVDPRQPASPDCVPEPNLVIGSALQTR